MAVYPADDPGEAPAYQIAWAIDAYTELDLGTTTAGTQVSCGTAPASEAAATTGTQHLVAAFDWFEKTLGPYRFGNHVGSVSVAWPRGAFGGMEHHPFWHVASGRDRRRGDERPRSRARLVRRRHPHRVLGGLRAVRRHGQLSRGARARCRRAGRRREGVAGYTTELARRSAATDQVWPQSCGAIDIIKDNLFTHAPYMRGAFFYKGVADKLGADSARPRARDVSTGARRRRGTMQDMLDTIKTVTGYDATACAQTWLERHDRRADARALPIARF